MSRAAWLPGHGQPRARPTRTVCLYCPACGAESTLQVPIVGSPVLPRCVDCSAQPALELV